MGIAAKTRAESATEVDLCSWTDKFADSAWHRIAFCRHSECFKIYETTLTQDMVLELNAIAEQTQGILVYESLYERANGNDIELYLQGKSGKFHFYAIQAKIVYQNGFYSKIPHEYRSGVTRYQLDSLIDYAKNRRGNAFYFLYSQSDDVNFASIARSNVPYTRFGVAVVSADYITKTCRRLVGIKPPSFAQIVPRNCITLNELICKGIINSYIEGDYAPIAARLLLQDVPDLREFIDNSDQAYELDDIVKDRGWIRMQDPAQYSDMKKIEGPNMNFVPKYRFVIRSIEK